MSSTTRCPFCETKFRVVPDQLRISGGWVRCGKCGELFHAISCLQSDEDVQEEVSQPSLKTAAAGGEAAPEPHGDEAGRQVGETGAVAGDSEKTQTGSPPSPQWASRSRQQKHIPEFLRAPRSVSTHVVLQDAVPAAEPEQTDTPPPHDGSQVNATTVPGPVPEEPQSGAVQSSPQVEAPSVASAEPLSPDVFATDRPLTGQAPLPTPQEQTRPEESTPPSSGGPDRVKASATSMAGEPARHEHAKEEKTPAGVSSPGADVSQLKITAQAAVVAKTRLRGPVSFLGSGELKASSVLSELRSDDFRTYVSDAVSPPRNETGEGDATQPQARATSGSSPDCGDEAGHNLLEAAAQAEGTEAVDEVFPGADDEVDDAFAGLEVEEEIDFSLEEPGSDLHLKASPLEGWTDMLEGDFSNSAPVLLMPSVPNIPGGYELPAPKLPLSDDEDPFPEFGFDDPAPETARQVLMDSQYPADSDFSLGEDLTLEPVTGTQKNHSGAATGGDGFASGFRSRRDEARSSGARDDVKKKPPRQGSTEEKEPASAGYLTSADEEDQEDDSGLSSWPVAEERRAPPTRRRSGNTRFPDTRSAQRRSGSTRLPNARTARRRSANTRFPEEDAALERDRRRLARSRSRLKRSGGSVPVAGSDWGVVAENSMPEQMTDVHSSSFMRRARRREFWQQTRVRAVLALLLVLVSVLLALQIAVHERDALAASRPGMRPALEALCKPLGCTVSPLKQLSAIRIDSDSFNEQQPGIYVATIMLKNTSAADVAMPSLELALSDINGLVVVRRVLTPAELGAPAVLPAGGEWQKSQYIRVPDADRLPRFTGYEFSPFYPS